ncbi:MAG: amidophosphoribosyltransferase [Lachnospiraceae bacterium]|nr:amidophosphoribosyltransferase [Lachnospiraceae bacterium]
MGGIFGVVSKSDCVMDLYFGIDYHSHLGTRRGGMTVYTESGFDRSIHSIENTQFRTRFEEAASRMHGRVGIGCISDTDPQPLIVRSRLGNFAITTVGRINNINELVEDTLADGRTQFLELSGNKINPTELVAALINQRPTIAEGIRYAQQRIDGSMTFLVATSGGIYAARDYLGRTPLIIGQKEDGSLCASFESHAYLNLGYRTVWELGPAEVVFLGMDGKIIQVMKPRDKKRVCSFLWTYYGYPTAAYEGINVEASRYRCGAMLAKADEDLDLKLDSVGGIPDSGLAAAIGYANESKVPFHRPFMKYTPTWARSFMPQNQEMRNLVAHMKLIPVHELINGKSLLFIDDSIVRGTQLRETVDFLYESGAKEVHVRPACPPIMYGCKFLNFSRSTSDMDLITRRTIVRLEGGAPTKEQLERYQDASTPEYAAMVEEIRKEMHFTSLRFPSLDMVVESIGLPECELCTYCWSGKE